jgi:hypothetical protein
MGKYFALTVDSLRPMHEFAAEKYKIPNGRTAQSGRPASVAQTKKGSCGLGVEQQLRGQNAALSGTLLRGKGWNGCIGRGLLARIDPLGYRDLNHLPGAFTGGTNHSAHAGSPTDKARVAEYEAGPYKG